MSAMIFPPNASLLSQIAQAGNGLNFGTRYLEGLKLKGELQKNQLANRMDEAKLGQMEQEQQRNGLLRGLRQQALQGDQGAMRNLAAESPTDASDIQALIGKMSADQRTQAKERVEDLARAADWVQSQPDPAAAYVKARQYLAQNYPDLQLSEQYDAQQVDLFVQQIKPITEMFKTPDLGETFKQSRDLRKEFTDGSKGFVNVRDAYNRIQVSAQEPSPAGDMSLIFNYMKMLDPGSVVRESEFQLAGDAGSLPERVQAAYNRIKSGERLSDEMRGDFAKRSSMLYDRQAKSQGILERKYKDLSTRYKINPDEVLIDYGSSVAQHEEPPAAADPLTLEVGGKKYRFPDAQSLARYKQALGGGQ